MKIRLKQSVLQNKKRYPVGTMLNVTNDYAKELISAGKAEEYKDGLPVQKVKTDFFKPKNKKE
jgi:hypothetical protein